MEHSLSYLVFGTESDEKTKELLKLVAAKGFKVNLVDLRLSPKAHGEFLSRGFAYIPVLAQEAEPTWVFTASYRDALDQLNMLADVTLEIETPIVDPVVVTHAMEPEVASAPEHVEEATLSDTNKIPSEVTTPVSISETPEISVVTENEPTS